MREIHDRAEAVIEGDTRALFAAITDIDRLPEWNGAIERVLERPDRLDFGAKLDRWHAPDTWRALEERVDADRARPGSSAAVVPHRQRGWQSELHAVALGAHPPI